MTRTVVIPQRVLAHLRSAHADQERTRVQFQVLLNCVTESLGLDPDLPGLRCELDSGTLIVPEVVVASNQTAEALVASATSVQNGHHSPPEKRSN